MKKLQEFYDELKRKSVEWNTNNEQQIVMPPMEDFTCAMCLEKESCKYVFDLYNTNGDCIAGK